MDSTVGWSGYRYDQPTRLYAVRFRFYDAVTFRWLNRDPAGYEASMNLYGYGMSNPIGGMDPFGLERFDRFSGGDPRDQPGDVERAIADCTAVIGMPDAPAEKKAMARVIRGMTSAQQGRFGAAVDDLAAGIETDALPVDERQRAFEALRTIAAHAPTCEPAVMDLRRRLLDDDSLPAELRSDIQARINECTSRSSPG